ncbi:MAG: leucine-rich repeat domain-containing protein, partial [Ruminococcus sp.]|nr:leucine-rich repeat domain-containing protein [Ruminococcus sp.]
MFQEFNIENEVLVSYNGESHSIVVPYGVKVISSGVFKGKSWITDIILPEGLNEIGDNAFKGCRKLERINFPESLTKIGDFAFHR